MFFILAAAVSATAQLEKSDSTTGDIKEDNGSSMITDQLEGPKHNGAGIETAELMGAGAAGLVGGLIVGAALGGEGGYGYNYNHYPGNIFLFNFITFLSSFKCHYFIGSYGGSPYYPNPYPYYPNTGYQPAGII